MSEFLKGINKEKELEELREKQVSSETLLKGIILHMMRDKIICPSGNESTRELVRHIGAVCVVPITEDGKVILERQYRYPLDSVITEIPAGKLDSKTEDPLEAAKRELREETGYVAEDWTDIGDFYSAPAYSDELIHMYLAKGLKKGERDLDEDEFINVIEIPLEEAKDAVLKGEITDAKTQTGILKAYTILCPQGPQR